MTTTAEQVFEKYPNLGWSLTGAIQPGKEEVRNDAVWQVQQLAGDCGFRWTGWLPKDEDSNHDAVRELLEAHGETCAVHHKTASEVWHLRNCQICWRRRPDSPAPIIPDRKTIKQAPCGVKNETSGGACTGAATDDDGEGAKRCIHHAVANLRRLLAAARADLPPAKFPRLEELLTGLQARRSNLAAHACAGFDCATCEPSRDVEELGEVIDMVTGRNVE